MLLHEKAVKVHEMPCHHNRDEYLHANLQTAAMEDDRKVFLFRLAKGHSGTLSGNPMIQADVYGMIGRRAAAASVARIGYHSFRATGITEYTRNGGKLEVAQETHVNQSQYVGSAPC